MVIKRGSRERDQNAIAANALDPMLLLIRSEESSFTSTFNLQEQQQCAFVFKRCILLAFLLRLPSLFAVVLLLRNGKNPFHSIHLCAEFLLLAQVLCGSSCPFEWNK